MTVIAVHMDREEAQRVTERIRLSLDTASRVLGRLASLVADAYERRADLALGYGSWAEYSEAEFAEQTRDLSAPIRRELVGYLSASGMPTRAIAPAMQVSRQAVQQIHQTHERQVARSLATSPHPEPAEYIDPSTGEILTNCNTGELLSPKVTGLDGKTYARPEPQQQPTQKRRPLPDAFGEGVYQLRLKVESLDRLTRDDRFAANKEKTAQTELRRLINTRDLLEQVIDQLS